MEFCPEFAVLQGTLISAQKNFGSLNTLTNDHADSIAAIIEATKNVLHNISEENSKETENCLRKINLFLILNSDLSIRDSLMDDMNCGHIVGCTPVMSMHLLTGLVWGLSLEKYFFETIKFSPPSLGVELLVAACGALKHLHPKLALQAVDELCQATYFRALSMPSDQDDSQIAINQLFVKFKTLLNFFVDSNAESLTNFSNKELHEYAGHLMERLLNLLNFCLAKYLARETERETPAVYDFKCPWDNSSYVKECEELITLENFNNELLSICKCNLNHVTVDEWLEWMEFTAKSDSSKTQQCVLAEKMYVCKESLDALNQPDKLVRELTLMLASMARKPRDEEDEIREAGFEEIIQCVSSPSKSRSKWLKALLKQNDLKNEQCLCCLESNLDLVDGEDAETILQLVVSHLEQGIDDIQGERLKCLALSAVQHVNVDAQIKILQNFLGMTGFECAILLTKNFSDKVTEALNKAIAAPQEVDKLLSDCTCLCLESPRQVLEQLLAAGISNSSQGRMVVRVLERLGIVCDLPCEENNTLLLQSVESLMSQHRDWSDTQRENFAALVRSLAKRNFMDGSAFMRKCLLPALHTSMVEKLWSSVLLYLQTLQLLLEIEHCKLNNVCLLVLMVQIIEASQWNMFTFSLEMVHVHEKGVHILNVLTDRLDVSSGSQVKWVHSKLSHFPAQVWSYLSKVWNPWVNAGPMLCDLSIILLYAAHGQNQHAITTLQTSKYTRLEWLLALVEVIPTLTAEEWSLLTENLAALNPGPLTLFHLMSDALVFIFIAISSNQNQTVVSCAEYIVRNFGAFIKNFVLPVINGECQESALQVFEKCVQLLTLLPETVEESTILQLSNIFAEVISIVMCSGNMHTQHVAGSIAKLRDGEMKQALALKLHVDLVDSSEES